MRKTGKELDDMMCNALLANIAGMCHAANRRYCASIGDNTQPRWEDAPQWQKDSAINGVRVIFENADMTPEDLHNNWMKEKIADGWVYGPQKNVELKTHHCLMPYSELPEAQRKKDEIFLHVVWGCMS